MIILVEYNLGSFLSVLKIVIKFMKNKITLYSKQNIPFIYYNNFAKVVVGNNIYHFGIIQSKVIKQLYLASNTDSPWVFGKELLYKAGSSSIRVSGLFRSKPKWRKIIESDRKGYYRLHPSLILHNDHTLV